jgi:hypothetical protein
MQTATRRTERSTPRFGILEERDTWVTMPDGTRLCVDVFRPDAPGQFPALVALSPYGKDVQHIGVPQQPAHSITFDHSIEAGNVSFFVPHGYAMVIGDLRGTGKSEGTWLGFYNPQDQRDARDVIEWAAEQPWCDGNVGMSGHSYYGIMQPLTAAQQPPHLRAIAPIETMPSLYEKAYPGGITSTWYSFVLHMATAHTVALDSATRWSPEELKERIARRLADPDIRANSFFVREFNAPTKNAAFVDQLLHPNYDEFWEERSVRPKLPRIQVPMLLASFWGYYGLIDGAFEAFTHPALAHIPKRLLVLSYGTSTAKLPLRLYDDELLRWYDQWLKGVDTGVLDEPPMRLFIPGRNVVRSESEWPLARTDWTRYYLRRYEELDVTPETDVTEPDAFVYLPPTISARLPSIRYSTGPFVSAVEMTGPASLTVYAAIDKPDANFIATLWHVEPSGKHTLVTKGYLRASHRAVDASRSTVGRPFHPFTDPMPATPGEVMELQIAFSAMSIYFRAGHRLELEIGCSDAYVAPADSTGMGAVVEDKMNAMGVLPSSTLIYYTIFRDRDHPSHLLLPVLPDE